MHLQPSVDEGAARRMPAPGKKAPHRHVVDHLPLWLLRENELRGPLRIETRGRPAPEITLRAVALVESVRPDIGQVEGREEEDSRGADARRPLNPGPHPASPGGEALR